MLTVELKRLGKYAGLAVRFLDSNLNESLRVKGARVQLTSTKTRTTKLLLHKFLRQEALEDYRVIIVRPDLIEVLGPKRAKQHTKPDDVNLFPANETIPYYQAAAEMRGIVPKPDRRVRWKP
jgi:hypothetical protein